MPHSGPCASASADVRAEPGAWRRAGPRLAVPAPCTKGKSPWQAQGWSRRTTQSWQRRQRPSWFSNGRDPCKAGLSFPARLTPAQSHTTLQPPGKPPRARPDSATGPLSSRWAWRKLGSKSAFSVPSRPVPRPEGPARGSFAQPNGRAGKSKAPGVEMASQFRPSSRATNASGEGVRTPQPQLGGRLRAQSLCFNPRVAKKSFKVS